jgi:hypothetical protein
MSHETFSWINIVPCCSFLIQQILPDLAFVCFWKYAVRTSSCLSAILHLICRDVFLASAVQTEILRDIFYG